MNICIGFLLAIPIERFPLRAIPRRVSLRRSSSQIIVSDHRLRSSSQNHRVKKSSREKSLVGQRSRLCGWRAIVALGGP
jgi:hypothetical protein